jgi:hypothetical protein
MRTIVLRGDWTKLCRSGDRVWLRVRPKEVVWRTEDDFTVDAIRSLSIEPIRLELKRKSRIPARGDTRLVGHAITRVVIAYGTDGELEVDLHEPEAKVVAAFEDLRDRFGTAEVIDLVEAERLEASGADTDDGLPYISWRPAPGMSSGSRGAAPASSVARDPGALVAVAERHDPDLAREVSFKLELGAPPDAVGRWLHERVNGGETSSYPSSDADLFADGDPFEPSEGGQWVVKRRKRRLRHRLRRSGSAHTSR